MTLSPTLHVRQTVIAALRADVAVTALIPAARLYPEELPQDPVRPFGHYGASSSLPSRPSCWAGGEVSAAYHVWVARSDTVLDPAAWCANAVAAVADAIDGLEDCYLGITQVLKDGATPGLYHGVIPFTFTALAEA